MLAFKIKNGRLSNNVLYVCHSLEINWQKNTVSKLLLNQCEVFGINVFSKLMSRLLKGKQHLVG